MKVDCGGSSSERTLRLFLKTGETEYSLCPASDKDSNKKVSSLDEGDFEILSLGLRFRTLHAIVLPSILVAFKLLRARELPSRFRTGLAFFLKFSWCSVRGFVLVSGFWVVLGSSWFELARPHDFRIFLSCSEGSWVLPHGEECFDRTGFQVHHRRIAYWGLDFKTSPRPSDSIYLSYIQK